MGEAVTAMEWLAEHGPANEDEARAVAVALMHRRDDAEDEARYAEASTREWSIAEAAFAAGVAAVRHELERLVGAGAETVRAEPLRSLRVKWPQFDTSARLPFGPDPEAARIMAQGVRAGERRHTAGL